MMPVAQRFGQALLLPVHDLDKVSIVVGPAYADLRIEGRADLVHLIRAQSWCVRGPWWQETAETRKEPLRGEVVTGQDQVWSERLLQANAEARGRADVVRREHWQDGAESPST